MIAAIYAREVFEQSGAAWLHQHLEELGATNTDAGGTWITE